MTAQGERYCFLIGKTCDIGMDIKNPSCFVSLPFKRKKELAIIKRTLDKYKLESLVADSKPPQFLFHDVCENISKAIFGVFEVTDTNEGVFAEYGIMVEQGKPAILLYNKTKRRKELQSDMKGTLQTRYQDTRHISRELSRTLQTLHRKMRPPEGSVLKSRLLISEFHVEVRKRLKSGFIIDSSKLEMEYLKEYKHSIVFRMKMHLGLKKQASDYQLMIAVDLWCSKDKVSVGVFNLQRAHVKEARTPVGKALSRELEIILPEIEMAVIDAFSVAETRL